MEAASIQNVCRLCPETGSNQKLLNIFDPKLAQLNMKQVILDTTGLKISKTDLVSTKICVRCCRISQKMLQFKQDAWAQDMALKMKCNKLLSLKGFNIPETQVDVNHNPSSSSKEAPQTDPKSTEITEPKTLSSVEKLNMEPTVLLLTDQVDKYFQQRNLDLTKYLYKPKVGSEFINKIKQTENFKSSKTIERKVTPITIQKQKEGTYVCSAVRNKKSTETTQEEYKIAAKIAKRDHISQSKSNEAIKSKQNNTTESTLRNTSSTVASDMKTHSSTNIPNTSKEHKTEKNTNNETIPTLISHKDKRTEIKPNVRIKNDKTINLLPNNLKGHKLIHSILSNIVSTENTKSAEKMLQTTQPSRKDININPMEDTCTVKGLRDQLRVFTIPVNVSNGPFSVGFRFKNPQNPKYCHSLLRDSSDFSGGNRRE